MKQSMRRGQGGFTLVEVIVVAGIIAILAGVLVPLILKEIDEARSTRAYADVRSLSAALLVFRKDTGKWPTLDGGCSPTATFLYGDGNLPGNLGPAGYDQATSIYLNDYLMADASGCYGARWKGPYLAGAAPDAWGNAYVMNADGFAAAGPVWIISAGPDGQMDTAAASISLQGDDVGIRLK
jgi:general secretion pathway protein G